MALPRNLSGDDVARRGARDEHHESVRPSDAISSGGNRIDRDADDRH
jgi:hypothetical protein